MFIFCSPDRSYCVCGPNLKGVGNDDFYETKSSFGVQVVQVIYVSVYCCINHFVGRGRFSFSLCSLAEIMVDTADFEYFNYLLDMTLVVHFWLDQLNCAFFLFSLVTYVPTSQNQLLIPLLN